MGSSLATDSIENGAARALFISLAGHLLLVGLVFLLPGTRKKVFVESIPRSVRLVASLDVPAPPRAKPRTPPPPAKPARPRPRVVKPPPPPPPVTSKVRIPVREAPPLVTPREPLPAPTRLKDRLQEKLAKVESPAAAPPAPPLPEVTAPKVTPLAPPTAAAPPAAPPVETPSSLAGFRYRGYVGKVKSTLYARWQPPSSFTLGGRRLTAVVMIRISRDGRIASVDVKRQSGHRIFDQSVMAALTDRSPLPPLPEDFKENYLDVEITFRPEDR